MKFVIVAETGSDIPKDLAEKYGIYIVPMHVTFGNEFKDDGTFPAEEVCKYYEKTGQSHYLYGIFCCDDLFLSKRNGCW